MKSRKNNLGLGSATDYQLLRVTDAIRDGLRKRETMGAVFLDLTRAFHTVWHEDLVYKLVRLGLTFWRLTSRAGVFVLRSGLRNRSILSGPASPRSPFVGPNSTHDVLRESGSKLAIYADDIALYATAKHERLVVAVYFKGP